VRVRGDFSFAAGPAEAFFPDDLAVFGDGDSDGRQLLVSKLLTNRCPNVVEWIGVGDSRDQVEKKDASSWLLQTTGTYSASATFASCAVWIEAFSVQGGRQSARARYTESV
jgi:hypothetical protein